MRYTKPELPEGFRYIEQDDVSVPFECGHAVMDRYGLEYYYQSSIDATHLVILRIVNGSIAGVMELFIRSKHIFIEKLARNRYVESELTGTKLVSLAEDIARKMGKESLQLLSLPDQDLVNWYENLGFYQSGPPRDNPEYGLLIPMHKGVEDFEK